MLIEFKIIKSMSSTHQLPIIFSAQNATESHEIYLALRQKNLQVTRCAAIFISGASSFGER
jgi:hypothetical protein